MKKIAAVLVLLAGFVAAAPAMAEVEQINVEKIKTFMQKESDRSGFSGTTASANSNVQSVGNKLRDGLIGGFHMGPAGSDDKASS